MSKFLALPTLSAAMSAARFFSSARYSALVQRAKKSPVQTLSGYRHSCFLFEIFLEHDHSITAGAAGTGAGWTKGAARANWCTNKRPPACWYRPRLVPTSATTAARIADTGRERAAAAAAAAIPAGDAIGRMVAGACAS